jgi:outer membrane receptor protein involved in Fe transport
MTQKRLTVLFVLLSVMVAGVWAQTETGQISGTLQDPTNAVVPNAKVTVKGVETGVTRVVTSSSSGVYTVPQLQAGIYTVTVEAAGFSSSAKQVTVTVGSRQDVNFSLEVGKTGTTIEVAESAAVINTETQTLGSVISRQQIIELPTLTGNPYALVVTVGNVTPTDPSGRGAGFSINGQRSAGTNVLLDGTANNDEFTASVGQQIPMESTQEFSVLTNNYTAEYGRASAGVVNVITRSGTNTYNGALYEYGRFSRLASNDFDNNANGIAKPVFTRNQFGYAIGGPVTPKLKNKLFFFSNTEWIRVRSAATRTVWVPTPQFIALANANTQNFFKSFGALRSNLVDLGVLTKAQFLARGQDFCKGLAATSLCASIPGTTPMFDRVSYGYPSDSGGGSPQNTYMTVAKVDFNMSDRTQMYWRYALFNESDFSGVVSNSPYAGYDSPNTQRNNSILWSITHTFTPNFVSQSKVDFNRFNNQQPFGTGAPGPTMYLGSASVATTLLGNNVAMPGYDPFTPGNSIPFGGPQNFVELYHDMSLTKNKHHIQFGAGFTYLRDNRTFGAYETAVEVLGNNVPKGIDNFMAGNLYQFQAAVYPQGKYPCANAASPTPDCTVTLPVGPPNFSRSNRYKEYALYAQDSWKVSPRLTVNLGLRWEVFGPQHNKDPKLDSNFYFGSGSNIYQQIAAGSVQLAPNSPIGAMWKTAFTNFGPMVGAAYDLTGDGKTSLRGGYGRHFERNFGNVTFNVIQNPPNYAVLSLFGGVDLPVIPVSTSNAGPLAGSTGTKALPAVSLRAVDPNIKTAYVDSFSAAVEHRFAGNIIGALEFSGSRGRNQYGIANINKTGSAAYYLGTPCTPGGPGDVGNCGGRLVSSQYSNINFRTNGGFADYNSLNTRVDWRSTKSLTMRFNYTWSHAIDTLSDTFSSSGNQQNLGWLDPFNPSIDKGDAYYDLRHRVALSGIYDIPVKGSSPFVKYVAGGWSLIPILQAYTGSPYSLYDCTNAYTVCPYAMFTKAPTSTPLTATATPNIYNYLDVSKIVDSSYGSKKIGASDFGPFPSNMIGRNAFRTPGFWNLDFAIHKNILFGEKKSLSFRGEFFNVFNHPNLFTNVGDSDVSSVDYVSASYSGRRQVRLGVRLAF